VVAPRTTPGLESLAASEKIVLLKRSYQPEDLKDHHLVIAATDSPEVNRVVSEDATAAGIPVNSVDDPEHSTFYVPSVAAQGSLVLAVSTSGAAPYLARKLRVYLESKLYPGLAKDLENVRAARMRIITSSRSAEQKREQLERELDPLVSEILVKMENP
jgi:siroheme synthase-like protein